MKRNSLGTIGLILLGAGLVVLAYGGYEYYQAGESLGGKISNVFNKLSDDHYRAIYIMVAGGVAAFVGIFLSRRR